MTNKEVKVFEPRQLQEVQKIEVNPHISQYTDIATYPTSKTIKKIELSSGKVVEILQAPSDGCFASAGTHGSSAFQCEDLL